MRLGRTLLLAFRWTQLPSPFASMLIVKSRKVPRNLLIRNTMLRILPQIKSWKDLCWSGWENLCYWWYGSRKKNTKRLRPTNIRILTTRRNRLLCPLLTVEIALRQVTLSSLLTALVRSILLPLKRNIEAPFSTRTWKIGVPTLIGILVAML